METYHRKRSRRGTSINATTNNEMISSIRKEKCSVLDGSKVLQAPPFNRQLLLIDNNEEDVQCDEVELGSVYEIYHKNLPPRTPVQLRCTRVVMVSEKTDLNVAIRYPSILSLRTYFSHGSNEMYPALDEKFVMGTKLASKVLLRQVPSQEFAAKKHLKGFWLVNPSPQTVSSNVALKNENIGLARELKNNEMVRWGVRRQVMFIGRHKDNSKTQSSSSFVNGDDQENVAKGDETEEEDQQVDDEADDEDEIVEIEEDDEEVEHEKDETEVKDDKAEEEEEDDEEEEEEAETHDDEAEQEENDEETKEEEEEAHDEDDDEEADQKVVEMRRKLRKRKKSKQVGNMPKN